MKKNMKTVTVTRVGHPLPHPTTPGLAPEITVQVFFNQESVTLPSSPLSMLIRTGDTLTFEPDGNLRKVNHLTAGMLNEHLLGFEGEIDRVSHPLWLSAPNGQPELCVIVAAGKLMFALKADWNTLLLRDGDCIELCLEKHRPIRFHNQSLGFAFTPAAVQSAGLQGQIKRVAHPMTWPGADGIIGLKTLVLMEDLTFKILKASPESMFLQDNDLVKISNEGIKNAQIPQIRYAGGALPEYYEVKAVGHPFPVILPNGAKQLSRYLITKENKIYRLPADENNMSLRAGDKVFQN